MTHTSCRKSNSRKAAIKCSPSNLSLKPLSFLGDTRRPQRVQQTDLAATLAIGLGLPIPKTSVGSLLLPVVERKPMREQLRFLHLNTVQLSKLLKENVPSYQKGESVNSC